MPANDPFQQDRQKEFQARITALLLGEHEGSVAAELHEAIDADPELIKLRNRLEKTIGLLGETTRPAEALPLDEDHRAALFEQFKQPIPESTTTDAPAESPGKTETPGRPSSRVRLPTWIRPIGLAASLIGLLTVVAISFVTVTRHERATVQVMTELTVAEEMDRESVEIEKGWAEALPMKSETLDTDSFMGFEFDSFSVNEDTESGTINVKSIDDRDSTTQPNPHYLTGSVKPAGAETGKSKPALAESVSFGVSPLLLIEDLESVDLRMDDPGPFVPQSQAVASGEPGVPLSEIIRNLRRPKQSIHRSTTGANFRDMAPEVSKFNLNYLNFQTNDSFGLANDGLASINVIRTNGSVGPAAAQFDTDGGRTISGGVVRRIGGPVGLVSVDVETRNHTSEDQGSAQQDKLPLVGDLPLTGRMFRSGEKPIARQSKEFLFDTVTVEAEFANVTQQDNRGIGFDWELEDMVVDDDLATPGGIQASFAGQPSQNTKPVPPMETRTFKVDPNTFIKGLEGVVGLDIAQLTDGRQAGQGGGGRGFNIPRVSVTDNGRATNGSGGIRFMTQTNSVADSTRLVRQFFAASEVTFTNGTQVFFNDRNGVIMVRATPQDLEIIQNAVEILSPPKPKAPEPKPEPAAPPTKPAPTPRAKPNPEVQAKDNPFSTFSLNVSDVSFKLAAASLEKGSLPDPATIRSEEFVNAFDYRDPAPTGDAKLAFAFEQARDPFAHNRNLMRFAVQTAALGREPGRPLNLVVLLDNSGSMERPDRVAIVREALRVLSAQLTEADRVSVVAFARTPRLCVDGLPGNQSEVLLSRVLDLNPQGGTNLEAALNAAYATAQKHFRENGNNRVILFTDGAANLGDINPEALKQKVESFRAKGVALDCFGIGWDGYNDDLMETLSRNGDGRYGFLNHPAKVAIEFADQLAGSLRVAASNVKAQIEFNPKRVISWRQIGYEKHQLKKEQFRDNKVDAAEIGAAESGTALYSIQADPEGSGPIGVARIRFMNPATGRYEEQSWPLAYDRNSPTLDQAAPSMRLAACAAAFAEWLARSPYAAEVTPDALLGYLNEAVENYALDARPRQLQSMIQHARLMGGQ